MRPHPGYELPSIPFYRQGIGACSAPLLRGDLYQMVSVGAGSHFDELQDLTGSNVDHAVEK